MATAIHDPSLSTPLRSLANEEVDDDVVLSVAELRSRHALLVVHAKARHDALRRLVAGIDDGGDARLAEGFEDVMHGGGAGFRSIAAAPEVAREPPSDLEIAGGAERLHAAD